MGEQVKVLGNWGSPFSHRVRLALRLKGIPYEYIEEEDFYKNKSSLLLKYNPVRKKIPVLLHDGKPIAESLIIVECIDKTWEVNPILSEDPYEKAMARFWSNFIDDKCWPAIRKAIRCPENKREKSMEEASKCLKTLESSLNGNKFFGGDTIGLADIAANFIAFWLRIVQEAVSSRKLLGVESLIIRDLFDWSDELVNCSVDKETLPPRDKLLGVLKAQFAAGKEAQ